MKTSRLKVPHHIDKQSMLGIFKPSLVTVLLTLLVPASYGQIDAQLNYNDPDAVTSSSRIKRSHPDDESSIIMENIVPLTIDIPEKTFQSCQAEIALEYFQRDTQARVKSTVSHENCRHTKGNFVISLTVRDENDETRKLEFDEQWELKEEPRQTLTKDYFIGDNVYLVRARTRSKTCECLQE